MNWVFAIKSNIIIEGFQSLTLLQGTSQMIIGVTEVSKFSDTTC
jgi:hypothetical protein